MLSDDDVAKMRLLPMDRLIRFWDGMEKEATVRGSLDGLIRELCLKDLFYLMVRVCGRVDMLHPWVYARVREVESEPNGRVDLWARGHGKSSTITFGKTVQDILSNPEITFGIFSHTRPIAKAFLRQIMREFEGNKVLHRAFPDVLWGMDTRQSPKWSEDDGLIVRRKSNPPEATIEAWGLVDGQPTSKHFQVLLYDDIVVAGSVTTPEMIAKTMESLEQSYNLSSKECVMRFAGTRWHFNDAYRTVIDRKTAVAREHPCTIDGTEHGDPVFLTAEAIQEKRRNMGPYTFAAQMLLNPKADALQGFKREWLRYYTTQPKKTNNYILVDAASSKKKGSDYTSMWVIGLGVDGNYYAMDMVRDRLSLTERTAKLFDLHRKWSPMQVRYERYGAMADIEHIKTEQEKQSYRFDIIEVAGQTSKIDRIGRLIPLFEQGKIYIPRSMNVTDYTKVTVDLVHSFIEEEFMPFPVGIHDDMLDSLARIQQPDMELTWPKERKIDSSAKMPYKAATSESWMQ
jgi:predicted phage terminase large subunit-like protein